MWLELASGAYLLLDFAYHRLTDDEVKKAPGEKPQVPRMDEGATVPLIYGRCRVRTPVLAYAGNMRADPAVGLYLPAEAITYGIDMLLTLGIPFEGSAAAHKVGLHAAWAGEQPLDWFDHTDGTGDGWVGGVQTPPIVAIKPSKAEDPFPIGGQIEFLNGNPSQLIVDHTTVPPTAMSWAGHRMLEPAPIQAGLDSARIPGYRGYLSAFLYNAGEGAFERGFFTGTSATPPMLSFEVSSYPVVGYAQQIGPDANPVDVIADILTGTFGKLGLDPALLDYTTFQAAAATLVAEEHGYSRAIADSQDAAATIGEILRQIDATMYEDPRTGTLKLKLIRADYDPNTVPNINPSNCLELQNYTNGGWRDTVNKVRILFSNRYDDFKEDSSPGQNLANAVGQGGLQNEIELHFPGVCNPDIAAKIEARELAVRSRPMAKCRAIVDRSFWATCPGDAITITWPEYNLNKVAFRVANVDRGQMRDGKIALDLLQDVFGVTQGAFPVPPLKGRTPPPEPLTYRIFTEAPYWLQRQAWGQGLVSSPDVQRVLAGVRPDDSALLWNETTDDTSGADVDVPLQAFPTTALVQASYARELEPYDTTTGLVIQSVKGTLAVPGTATAAQIHTTGKNLVLVGAELMAYESVTDLGGGQYRLNNVWRALLDTAPVAHAAGELVVWLSSSLVGRRGWDFALAGLTGTPHPILNGKGSSEDVGDTINVNLRGLLPSRGADFALCGEVMAGTQGLPIVASPAGQSGDYKKVTNVEEGFGYYFKTRDCLLTYVSRGDEADETPSDSDPTTWEIYGQKIRTTFTPSAATNDTEVAIRAASLGTALTAKDTGDAALLGVAGYGDLDVILHTRRTKPANGVQPQIVYSEWQAPKIRVRAERWRNLVANARFDYHGAGTNVGPGWVQASGSSQVRASTSSITRAATDCYAGLASGSTSSITETFDVTGYVPRGLTARLEFYARNLAGGSDTITSKIEALDVSNAVLATTTVTGGAITPANTVWTRYSGTLVLPANTTQLKVTHTFTTVLGVQNAVVTETAVRLGDTPQYDVITNSSFDVNLSSWTVDSGGFVQATAIASPSAGYTQGGAFASSVMHADYTLPAGYEVGGTVILNCWRAQTLANDTGDVDLEILDGSNVVIANQRTGAETLAVLNQWYKRRLAVTIPPGAVKVRVKITAVRTAGAGNSGACFDELVVAVHKDLSDPAYHRKLDFSTPTVQPIVKTWQEWHLAYARSLFDAGIADPAVISAATATNGYPILISHRGKYYDAKLVWSDGAVHATQLDAKLVGAFGGGNTSMPAVRSVRASGGAALHMISASETTRFANPTSSTSFAVIAYVKVDEVGLAAAAGIAGRTDGTNGWGLELDASGNAVATLWGASGSKTVTGAFVADGALHQIAACYDAVAHTWAIVVDGNAAVSTSTAAGLGEIANTSTSVLFRLGRSRTALDTFPGMIGSVYWFDQVLSTGQMQAHWNYGKDPTGALTTYTRDKVAWAPGVNDANGEATLVKHATNQVALGYTAGLTTDGGSGWGLALCKGITNLVPSFNLAGASWVAEGTTVVTQGIVDATGRPLGARVVTPNATDGFKVVGMTVGAAAILNVRFLARSTSGTPTIKVELANASGTPVESQPQTLSGGTKWTLYTMQFAGWDASSATCQFRFTGNAGAVTFELTSVLSINDSQFDVPSIWPDAGVTMADVTAQLTETQLAQANAEGEIIAVGVGTIAVPTTRTIAEVSNGANNKNRRELSCGSSHKPTLDHYDSAGPTNVTSQGTAIDWTQLWTIRGRWASTKMLDNATNPYAGIVTAGSVASAVYGRAATWTYDTTLNTLIRLGIGANAALSGYLRSLTVRAREEKLA
jgi:hypothetical protein